MPDEQLAAGLDEAQKRKVLSRTAKNKELMAQQQRRKERMDAAAMQASQHDLELPEAALGAETVPLFEGRSEPVVSSSLHAWYVLRRG